MERYRIYSTTDGKYIGKIFTIDESKNSIDITGAGISSKHRRYHTMIKNSDRVKLTNVNYTIKGKRI